MHGTAIGNGQPGLEHSFAEQVAVFGNANGVERGADEFNVVLFQYAIFGEGQGQVEASLSAHGGEHSVGFFLGNDGFQGLGQQRLDVGGVGQLGIGHHRGGVGIDEDDAIALRAQGLDCLGTGVVKFGGLADNDGTGAWDEDGVNVGAFGHGVTCCAACR